MASPAPPDENPAERQLALQRSGALLVRGALGRRALLAGLAVGRWTSGGMRYDEVIYT